MFEGQQSSIAFESLYLDHCQLMAMRLFGKEVRESTQAKGKHLAQESKTKVFSLDPAPKSDFEVDNQQ